MKKIAAVLLLAVVTTTFAFNKPGPVTTNVHKVKKVCIEVYDSKEKKNMIKCKIAKIVKKHKGTPIPKR